MKKILVVGFVPYRYKEKLAVAYLNMIWIVEREIGMAKTAANIIDLVNCVDAVMFMDENSSDRLMYEIACCMTNKRVLEKDEYPVPED